MNPYQTLLSHTVLFGISSFGARFLTFLLTPFYTRVLSSAEYGVTDLLIQTGNLLIPIASVGISNAVIRYGLEKSCNPRSVFTTGLTTTLAGFLLLLLFSPVLQQLSFLSGYVHLVLLYVLMGNLHALCNQFARTQGHVRLFALDGLVRTVLTIALNLLFLAVFSLGIPGYVLSNILADAAATLFVFLRTGQWRYLRLSALSRPAAARMLRYSAPLVPSTLCSWIINISDRYLIALLAGSAATGIYTVANKLPNILLTVASIFSSAWQLSALAQQPREEKERFFSNVCSVYTAVAFTAASAVILTARWSTRLLAAPAYYAAWRYVPILTLATAFACLSSFLSSIYMVEQRSAATLVTTVLGAACNLAGNALLIPRLGPMGAALSTLGSYVLLFLVRAVHTRPFLRIRWHLPRLGGSAALLALQCVLIETGPPLWPLPAALCLLAIAALHRAPLGRAVSSLRRPGGRRP